MGRRGFGFVALTLSIVVVFAPRPAGAKVPSSPGAARGWLAGRVLAPAIDAATLRESASQKPISDPITPHWWLCVIAAAGLGIRRWAFEPIDPPKRRCLVSAVAARGCRAPPLVPA